MKTTLNIGKTVVAMIISVAIGQSAWAGPSQHGGDGRCGPQEKKNTVRTVAPVLNRIAQSNDFKDAKKYQEFVAHTSKLKTSEEKMNAYFSVIGVDSKNPKEVMEFVGAREKSSYIEAAEKNLDLTDKQSEVLIKELNQAMVELIRKANK